MRKSMIRANRRTVTKAAIVALAMFGFGFALVPLYDVFCDITGLGGRTGRVEASAVGKVDTSRKVTVEFTGNAASGLPWEFRPLIKRLEVHPGEVVEVKYYVRNTASEALVGQAVPSVAPGRAAADFNKVECFCFTQQRLEPGESREMPVRFVVSTTLLDDVRTITLSYAFFNADKMSAAKYGGTAAPAHAHEAGSHSHAGS
jgi:cytochrome c oxidase assembly protein subunit 11